VTDRRIAETALEVLKILDEENGPLTQSEIEARKTMEYDTTNLLYRMKQSGYIKSGPISEEKLVELDSSVQRGRGCSVMYTIAKTGAKVLTELDKYEIHPYIKRNYSEKPEKEKPKKMQKASLIVPPQPQQRSLNLSTNAQDFMAQMSLVIQENANYRATMEEICLILCNHLGKKMVDIAPPQETVENN
jgi:hypothetical protein